MAHSRQADLISLLIFLSCDAVLLLHASTELDVTWLNRLRLLQSAKQALYAKQALLPEPLHAALAAPPPLLLAVLQSSCMISPAADPTTPASNSTLSTQASTRMRAIWKRIRPVGGAADPWALCISHPKQPAVVLPAIQPSAGLLHDVLLGHLLAGAGPAARGAAAGAPLDTGCDPAALHGLLQEFMQERAGAGASHGTTRDSCAGGLGWMAQALQQLEAAWDVAAAGASKVGVLGGAGAARQQPEPTPAPAPGTATQTAAAGAEEEAVQQLLPAVRVLEAASDTVYKLSTSLCSRALQAARQAYLSSLPPTYPLRVHRAAARRAAALLAASAHGPAMADVLLRLWEECDRAWAAGRQQCGAISCTGRSCGRPFGHTLQGSACGPQGHMGAAVWVRADPTGVQQLQVPDPFSLAAANDWVSAGGRVPSRLVVCIMRIKACDVIHLAVQHKGWLVCWSC